VEDLKTMKKTLRWFDHLAINIYWLGLNVSAGTITPVLLPYLVALFVPQEFKNSYLATVRVIGLVVAMMIQPMAGMLSDRSTSRWGRRRPFIFGGTMFDLVFLLIIGASPLFLGSTLDSTIQPLLGFNTAYAVLLVGIILLQASSNFAQGPLQALLPDLVPDDQRGRSSGVKTVLELVVPSILIIGLGIGSLVDTGRILLTVGIIGISLLITMLITVLFVHERPMLEKPKDAIGNRMLRLVALAVVFLAVTQGAVWLVRSSGNMLTGRGADVVLKVVLVGLAGLIGMAGSIFLGVYFGAWIGIGAGARKQTPFIWWVINRLMFLAAVGSIQGFAQYFLSDVLQIENPAEMTTILMAVVAIFLMVSALGGGYLADRIGRKSLVAYSALIAASGTLILLFSTNIPMVILSGCIIGTGTGTFMATNWALGTDLVPKSEAGRYLGISNLAGAGAGIVGAGIGGPMADFFNGLRPGLGYLVIFSIYAALFLVSIATLVRVPDTGPRTATT
jgi:MFS family permease